MKFQIGDKIVPNYKHSANATNTEQAISYMNKNKLKYLVITGIFDFTDMIQTDAGITGYKWWTHYKEKNNKSHLPSFL